MPDGQRKYTKELGRALHCSRRTRKQLMEQFDTYQHQILDDLPAPTYQQMVNSFGPPKEMAQTLMQEVSPAEYRAFQRNKIIFKICTFALIVVWFLLSIYITFEKNIPIMDQGTIYIESGNITTTETEEEQ